MLRQKLQAFVPCSQLVLNAVSHLFKNINEYYLCNRKLISYLLAIHNLF